jgi:uncharacterized protein YabE (DUF348 family)
MGDAPRVRPQNRRRRAALIVAAITVALATAAAGTFTALSKTVTVTVDGAARDVTTLSGTVAGALQSAGVAVGDHDAVAPGPSAAIGDGSTIVVDLGKRVTLAIDGSRRQFWTTGRTVQDALTAAAVTVGAHDTLAPAGSASISDGATVVIERGRELTLTIDGRAKTFWTTAPTVGQALAELGRSAGDYQLSADRSRAIPLQGLAVKATTLHSVSVVDGVAPVRTLSTPASTVGEVLSGLGISLGASDTVTPSTTMRVTDGLSIAVVRRGSTTLVRTLTVPQPATVRVNDADLDNGTKKVVTGHAGRLLVRTRATLVNGKVTTTKVIGRVTLVPAVATKIHVGTRPLLDWEGGRVFFHDTSFGVNWDGLATCESTNNPGAVNANPSAGYPTYGLFQFDLPTWGTVGGSGNPVDASPQEQLMRAKLLYQQRGLEPWACAYAAR